MKQNLIVVGDSFCSAAEHWPAELAKHLDLQLICHTQGAGQSWWDARTWLQNLSTNQIDCASVMIFAHTNAERIPTDNKQLGRIDHSAPATTETAKAIQLYFKHVFCPPFLSWAQQQWFKEISETYGHKKLVHLHCFPGTLNHSALLKGLNVTTVLTALSLNELGSKEFALYNDMRPNHLSAKNNTVLAQQLADLIERNVTGNHSLNIDQFDQTTSEWFDRL